MATHTVVVNKDSRTYQVLVGDAVTALHIVKLNATFDGVDHCGVAEDAVGQSENDIDALAANRTRGDTVSVSPLNTGAARNFVASAAISAGDKLGLAAGGKVATGTGLGFQATTAATADGDVIEAVPFV